MGNNTTEDIINQMSREDFFQYAITGLKDRAICCNCDECSLDYSYFIKRLAIKRDEFIGNNFCKAVTGYIAERLSKELTTLKPTEKPTEPEKEEPETENCSSCIYYRNYSGTGFCEIWHSFTQPYVYCSYHSAKEEEA